MTLCNDDCTVMWPWVTLPDLHRLALALRMMLLFTWKVCQAGMTSSGGWQCLHESGNWHDLQLYWPLMMTVWYVRWPWPISDQVTSTSEVTLQENKIQPIISIKQLNHARLDKLVFNDNSQGKALLLGTVNWLLTATIPAKYPTLASPGYRKLRSLRSWIYDKSIQVSWKTTTKHASLESDFSFWI